MGFDNLGVSVLFLVAILIVGASIESGYRLGRMAHRWSAEEKESPVSAIAGALLALLAFILAFTFSIASNRFDTRKELVRDEANKIRLVWMRSDFLPEGERAETKRLLRDYARDRIDAVQSTDVTRVKHILSGSDQIQSRLWDIAVANARKDMNSDIGALYVEALNEMFAVHASRVIVGLQMRIPNGIWLALAALTMLGMMAVGYQAGIAGSKRTLAMPLLALAFGLVIAMIGAFDRPSGGFIVSQQPLIDALSTMERSSSGK